MSRNKRPLPVDEAIEEFARFFLYGASVDAHEVDRLWGIQVQMQIVPLMERPLDEVRAQTLAEIRQMLTEGD